MRFRSVAVAVLAATLAAGGAGLARAQDGAPPAYSPPSDIGSLSGAIVSDGSTNTGPITQAAAEDFAALAPKVRISVDQAGSGGGFARFCRGETTIQNASRPIAQAEADACAANGIAYLRLTVALDGVTLVVNPMLDVTCLTTAQARALWTEDSTVAAFSDLDPLLPDDALSFYGPAPDSGTYQYFTEQIVGKDGGLRRDYLPSQDYNVLVNGISYDAAGTGIVGFAYYDLNRDDLRALAIDAGDGCVAPSFQTIANGAYAPLSRPLSIYVNTADLQRPEVREFVRFYLANAAGLVADTGEIPVPAATASDAAAALEAAIAGA